MTTSETVKVANLLKVQEYLIHKEPELLSFFLEETLQFFLDVNTQVRSTIAGFIEAVG